MNTEHFTPREREIAEALVATVGERDSADRAIAELLETIGELREERKLTDDKLVVLRQALEVKETSATALRNENNALHAHHAAKLATDSLVGSCDCLTKTPDIAHHKPGCRYRLITERDEARKAWEHERGLNRFGDVCADELDEALGEHPAGEGAKGSWIMRATRLRDHCAMLFEALSPFYLYGKEYAERDDILTEIVGKTRWTGLPDNPRSTRQALNVGAFKAAVSAFTTIMQGTPRYRHGLVICLPKVEQCQQVQQREHTQTQCRREKGHEGDHDFTTGCAACDRDNYQLGHAEGCPNDPENVRPPQPPLKAGDYCPRCNSIWQRLKLSRGEGGCILSCAVCGFIADDTKPVPAEKRDRCGWKVGFKRCLFIAGHTGEHYLVDDEETATAHRCDQVADVSAGEVSMAVRCTLPLGHAEDHAFQKVFACRCSTCGKTFASTKEHLTTCDDCIPF